MLRTERVRLRNLCRDDVECLFSYRNDPRCSRYQRYADTGREYLCSFVDAYCHSLFLSLEEEQHYAVCLHDGSMIGDLTVFFTEKDNCFTLGITIAPAYQNRGYGYELLKEVTDRLRQEHPGRELVALIEKGNEGSIALFRKLGFAEECYAESIASYVFVK